ncbi:hypothetical protein ARMSODRAFT_774225 [Armillaria solidipes]|uniref:Uncharacterized protein n=1 Tax=Armillaria solidipes TaxID=1076256 RepID=A0A2H3AXS7_9AGAR|nr:hypothetical protein ARMSODRAFT_774225 [Armillaria solidipes]
MTTSVENSAQHHIRQTCIDIEYAGGERILSSAAPSQMAACPERWICPQRDEYRLQVWYDVVGAIVQPSRLSLLAEEWTTSTRESTAEEPFAMTQAESPLTSVRTSTANDLGPFVSDRWRGKPSSFLPLPPLLQSPFLTLPTNILFTVGGISSTFSVDHQVIGPDAQKMFHSFKIN